MGASPPVGGRFALQSGAVRTQGHLRAVVSGRNPLERNIDLWLTGTGSQTIRRYDMTMTKYLHLVIVSDDFTTFMHVHPRLFPDGHFRIDQRFPKPATYHLYADADPRGIGQQVFRYDLAIGSPRGEAAPGPARRETVVRAGPYSVSLDSTSLRAGEENALAIHIREGGVPAKTLSSYLGAPAHAVFINARDLTYLHVHPMPLRTGPMAAGPAMGSMEMQAMPPAGSPATSPDLLLHVAVREAGTYRLWLEFRGVRGVAVAAFVVTAT